MDFEGLYIEGQDEAAMNIEEISVDESDDVKLDIEGWDDVRVDNDGGVPDDVYGELRTHFGEEWISAPQQSLSIANEQYTEEFVEGCMHTYDLVQTIYWHNLLSDGDTADNWKSIQTLLNNCRESGYELCVPSQFTDFYNAMTDQCRLRYPFLIASSPGEQRNMLLETCMRYRGEEDAETIRRKFNDRNVDNYLKDAMAKLHNQIILEVKSSPGSTRRDNQQHLGGMKPKTSTQPFLIGNIYGHRYLGLQKVGASTWWGFVRPSETPVLRLLHRCVISKYAFNGPLPINDLSLYNAINDQLKIYGKSELPIELLRRNERYMITKNIEHWKADIQSSVKCLAQMIGFDLKVITYSPRSLQAGASDVDPCVSILGATDADRTAGQNSLNLGHICELGRHYFYSLVPTGFIMPLLDQSADASRILFEDIPPDVDADDDSFDRLMVNITANGYELRFYESKINGNCFFEALHDQLILRNSPCATYTPELLRLHAVKFMEFNPIVKVPQGDIDLRLRTGRINADDTWEKYLKRMQRCDTWADENCVLVSALILNHDILLVTSAEGRTEANSIHTIEGGHVANKLNPLLLGHEHENHYYSLQPVGFVATSSNIPPSPPTTSTRTTSSRRQDASDRQDLLDICAQHGLEDRNIKTDVEGNCFFEVIEDQISMNPHVTQYICDELRANLRFWLEDRIARGNYILQGEQGTINMLETGIDVRKYIEKLSRGDLADQFTVVLMANMLKVKIWVFTTLYPPMPYKGLGGEADEEAVFYIGNQNNVHFISLQKIAAKGEQSKPKSPTKKTPIIIRIPKDVLETEQEDPFPGEPPKKKNKQAQTESARYQCNYCQQAFRTDVAFDMHLEENHRDENPFECPHCVRRFNLKGSLRQHLTVNHKDIEPTDEPDDPDLDCEQCDKTMSSKQKLREHYLKVHAGLQFICGYCNSNCETYYSWRYHLKKYHKGQACLYQCPGCSATCGSLDILRRHKLSHRFESGSKGKERSRSRSPVKRETARSDVGSESASESDSESSERPTTKPTHKQTVSSPQIQGAYVCLYCDETFAVQMEFDYHVQWFHPGKNSYKCAYCNFETDTRKSLCNHLNRAHRTGERTAQLLDHCEVCNKAMRTTYLRKHIIKYHAGYDYVCIYCNIKRDTDWLPYHRSHPGKPLNYMCPVCKATFQKDLFELYRHVRMHHPDIKSHGQCKKQSSPMPGSSKTMSQDGRSKSKDRSRSRSMSPRRNESDSESSLEQTEKKESKPAPWTGKKVQPRKTGTKHTGAKSPETGPAKSPEKSPAKGPEKSPAKRPKKSPAKSPEKSPAKSPDKGPVKSPEKSPEKSPAKSLGTESVDMEGSGSEEEEEDPYYCPICNRICPTRFKDPALTSVGCDDCDGWFHWGCVGLTEDPGATADWFCPDCTVKRQKKSKRTKKGRKAKN